MRDEENASHNHTHIPFQNFFWHYLFNERCTAGRTYIESAHMPIQDSGLNFFPRLNSQ